MLEKIKTANIKTAKPAAVLVFLGLLLAAPAAFADVVLKKDGFLSDNVVTVGDVFDNAGRHADHVLAPAPAPGEQLVLGLSDLMRISNAFDFKWQPQTRQARITLRRAATEVEKSDIARAVEAAVMARVNSANPVEVSIETTLPRLVLGGIEKPDITVRDLDYRPATGDFRIILGLEGATGQQERLDLAGRVHILANVPVLSNALRNGDVIRAADLKYQTIRQDAINQSIALDAEDLIGMTPRRALPSDRPVRMADVVRPQVVKKGEIITMTLKNGAMMLTAKGRALDNGSRGDIIRVLNASSNRVIDAEITGPQRAEITLTANRI